VARTRAVRNALTTLARLRETHPDAGCELRYKTPFQLLVATVLSAQTTDTAVNQLTPALFKRWPDAQSLARARVATVERALNRIGMYRQKAKNIIGLAQRLAAEHGGEVPPDLAALVKLPGVGRKTANVVLGVAFGATEGVVVDTHVARIAQRLGWTTASQPDQIEADLMRRFPRHQWSILAHTLIFHGRRVCGAARPSCAACTVADACPSAFAAAAVGRKPPRARSPARPATGAATKPRRTRPRSSRSQ
jgi:endonuclease-3